MNYRDMADVSTVLLYGTQRRVQSSVYRLCSPSLLLRRSAPPVIAQRLRMPVEHGALRGRAPVT